MPYLAPANQSLFTLLLYLHSKRKTYEKPCISSEWMALGCAMHCSSSRYFVIDADAWGGMVRKKARTDLKSTQVVECTELANNPVRMLNDPHTHMKEM